MDHARVHVIGASGRSGAALCRALIASGATPFPVVRNRARFQATGLSLPALVADLTDPGALTLALSDAEVVVSTAHARHAPAVIAASPSTARLVLLGSTRKFTRWPDAHGNGVLAGEHAFLGSGRNGVILHPTMIYGAEGEDNVRRLALLLRRLPVIPLPEAGAALVQPIHQDDVTRAIIAAVGRDWAGPHSLVIAGPDAVSYADFVAAVARVGGLAAPRILRVPSRPLIALAPVTRFLPFFPTIRPAEIRRLLEDKAFDIAPMRDALGFEPITLQEGLARSFPSSL